MKQPAKAALIIGVLLFLGAGCTLFKDSTDLPAYDFPTTSADNINSAKIDIEAPKVQAGSNQTKSPKNCADNEACANTFIKNCAVGSFIYGFLDINPGTLYTIKGKNQSGGCDIEWGLIGAEYPLTDLKMTCSVPNTVETVKQFDDVNLENKYINCSGPLKDTLTKPSSQIPPKPIPAANMCKDADCANRLLANCAEGTFTLTRANLENKGATVLDFRIKYRPNPKVCLAEVNITQSNRSELVGPAMECALREKVKTLFDVQNFISSKFEPLEENSYSSCIGDLYNLVKDLPEMAI